ncbi:MAG TPA: hypothetical protein PKD64_13165 [Pirellulaceae bacterium]|nr:hypothetical protein [Pirellulaceae bacterium]HMO93136.1 hypothetical protein [Pirellulaceae bacterium]HMP70305.1 hypothetical protein [Pirellulaceae bacterium]
MSLRHTAMMMLMVALASFMTATLAHGHFLWIVVHDNQYRIYFSEEPQPSQAEMLDALQHVSVWQTSSSTDSRLSTVPKSDESLGWLECSNADVSQPLFLQHKYGVLVRGESRFLLQYYGSYWNSKMADNAREVATVEFEVRPKIHNDRLVLTVLRNGKAVPDCEVVLGDDQGSSETIRSDENGQIEFTRDGQSRIWARARVVVPAVDSLKSDEYDEIRQFATLVFDFDSVSSDSDHRTPVSQRASASLPQLPIGVTSFGAAVSGPKIYVYGGHLGDSHDYARDLQSKTLYELDLESSETWNAISQDRGLQGLALVAHRGALYRLGGFEARNVQGESHELHSVADFRRFDIATRQWSEMPPLPEPRSSFDAVVVDDRIYVVGGWTMEPDQVTSWLTTAWYFDLTEPEKSWQRLPDPPFRRRAIAMAEFSNQLFVVGGMNEDNSISTEVAIFDLASQRWENGPELPAVGRMEGFGSAAFRVGNNLVVSTYSGAVYRLDSSRRTWQEIQRIRPSRFFHRLLPINEGEFVIMGGANMESGKPRTLVVGSLD